MITPEIADRLDRERIIWMTTVRADGQPQSAPVWYVWNGEEIRVWSLDGLRIVNLATNSKVNLHLNDNGRGEEVVTIEGEATIDRSAGPASEEPLYVERYQPFVVEYGWTWGWYDANYPVPIRVTPSRVRSW
ncbi:MAG: pyridoxamine 5'-phosphate oxidase family protein [Acidimicrobiia bacterium]|nr:pyridoxamine 5'-phosphate oxidase family protein [Acidimicrobiia bacterium]